MNLFAQAFAWIFDGAHWVNTQNGINIPQRLGETLLAAVITVVVVVVIAGPIGFYIGHTGRGRSVAIVSSNIARALPTLGLLAFFLLLIGFHFQLLAIVIVLVVLGIPPMLAGTYAGLEAIDRQVIDAARAVGMTEWQVISSVEAPLAAPLILGGFRSTALQVISTVTVAAYFSGTGLGYYIVQGQASANYVEMIAGAVLIIALVLIIDGLLSIVERLISPKGVLGARPTGPRASSQRRGSVAVIPLQEGS